MIRTLKPIVFFILNTIWLTSFSQGSYMASDEDVYHLMDRYTILHADKLNVTTSIKPLNRNVLNKIQFTLIKDFSNQKLVSKADLYNWTFMQDESWDVANEHQGKPSTNIQETKIWKIPLTNFYQYRGSFFSVDEPDFKLVVNPVFGLDMGQDQETSQTLFRNTRGAELRGSIGNKIGFYSFLSENQFRFPNYYNQWVEQANVVPGAGFIKQFGSNARDFFVTRGYVTTSPIKQINVQFGHDRNFIGNGYRSLVMSDFAKENLFLKLHTQVWRLSLLNIFSEYTDFHSRSTKGLDKKFGAFHHMNFNVIPGKLDIGLFEHIIFYRDNGRYETQYLNPIIFYRSVEQGLNSADNALLGLDFKWNPAKKVSFYGQYVLDEFHKNELFGRTGSWVNKWALQAGGKWLNVMHVANLDLQLEANFVRPYTYTHNVLAQAYTHYNQPIAHPLGANFKEYIAIVRYQPKPKWNVVLKVFNILQGLDSSHLEPTAHFGGDLLKDYEQRPSDTNIKVGDGVQQKLNILDLCLSYQMYHRTFFDVRFIYRDSKRQVPLVNQRSSLVYLGFRMNLAKMNFDF